MEPAAGNFIGRLFVNVWEEIGWRGFALPRLQARYNALTASLVLGLLWSLWHLPLYLSADNFLAEVPFYDFFPEFVFVSIIYTWIYNNANGSLLFVTLFHVIGNVVALLLLEAGLSLVSYLTAHLVIILIIAVALVVVFGPENLTNEKRHSMT